MYLQIAAAYEVLADGEKRKLYDQVNCVPSNIQHCTSLSLQHFLYAYLMCQVDMQYGEEGLRPTGPGGGFPGGGGGFRFQVCFLSH